MEKSTVDLGNTFTGNAITNGISAADKTANAADHVHKTVDKVATATHEAVDKFAISAADVAERLADQKRRFSEVQAQALDCSKSWIKDNPMQAVGAGVAIGFLLGRLTGR